MNNHRVLAGSGLFREGDGLTLPVQHPQRPFAIRPPNTPASTPGHDVKLARDQSWVNRFHGQNLPPMTHPGKRENCFRQFAMAVKVAGQSARRGVTRRWSWGYLSGEGADGILGGEGVFVVSVATLHRALRSSERPMVESVPPPKAPVFSMASYSGRSSPRLSPRHPPLIPPPCVSHARFPGAFRAFRPGHQRRR